MSDDRAISTARASSPRVLPLVAVIAVWLLVRAVFFSGFRGSDDFMYIRFAWLWDRFPESHWEVRVLYNALLRGSLVVFGFHEWAAALPTMLGSFLVLTSGMALAWARTQSMRVTVIAGLLVALMPLDVDCTTAHARPLAAGFTSVGLFFLIARGSTPSAVAAGALFGLGVVTHLTSLFFVGFALAAVAVVRGGSARRAVVAAASAVAVFVVLDLAVYLVWTGDALWRFGVASRTHLTELNLPDPHKRLFTDSGVLNHAFFWRPLQDLLASKPLGIVGVFAALGAIAGGRRGTPATRAAVLMLLWTWAWTSYGTQTPTRFAPFPDNAPYWRNLEILLALFAAEWIGGLRWRTGRVMAVSLVAAVALGSLSLAGSWGESVEVTRALADYAHAHPDEVFVTDDRTEYEMRAMNRFEPIPNVRSVTAWRAQEEVERARAASVLVNRLNWRDDDDASDEWLSARLGPPVFEGEPLYRMLTLLLPRAFRERRAWTVARQPPKCSDCILDKRRRLSR